MIAMIEQACLPNNETVELKNRRGSGALPLKPGKWNHMKVAVKADVVSLELNGQQIYERTLEPGNRRIFGLFNYADQSESRVRRVVMRGDWPKTIAPASNQELTTQQLTSLDTQRSNAAVSMIHQFSTDGLPEGIFLRSTGVRRVSGGTDRSRRHARHEVSRRLEGGRHQ